MNAIFWHFFSHKGCINRKIYALSIAMIFSLFFLAASCLAGSESNPFFGAISAVIFLSFYFSILILNHKRLHDMGFSGYLQLIAISTIITSAIILGSLFVIFLAAFITFLFAFPSKIDNNKYRNINL